jgi:hypothetical protein
MVTCALFVRTGCRGFGSSRADKLAARGHLPAHGDWAAFFPQPFRNARSQCLDVAGGDGKSPLCPAPDSWCGALPAPVVSVYHLAEFDCKISPWSEVEVTPNLTIGRDTQISSFVIIKASYGPLRIGERVAVATGVFMAAPEDGIEIGDDSMVGPNKVVIGVNYRYDRLDVPVQRQGTTSKGIRIGKDVWLDLPSMRIPRAPMT